MVASNDKKEYQSVQTALLAHATVTSILNKLTKIAVETEDDSLKTGLARTIADLKNDRHLKGSVQLRLTSEPYKSLFDYCSKCIASVTPQWQILAERNGWGPKNKPPSTSV